MTPTIPDPQPRDVVSEDERRPAGPIDWRAQPYPWNEIGPAFRAEVERIKASAD